MNKEAFEKRLKELVSAYDSQVERLHNIAGAIQETKLTLQRIEEEAKKESEMACSGGNKKGGKKK
jgi:hypothetical protein